MLVLVQDAATEAIESWLKSQGEFKSETMPVRRIMP